MKAKKDNKFSPGQEYGAGEDINMNKNQLILTNATLSEKCLYGLEGKEIQTGGHERDSDEDIARPLTQFRNIPGPPLG